MRPLPDKEACDGHENTLVRYTMLQDFCINLEIYKGDIHYVNFSTAITVDINHHISVTSTENCYLHFQFLMNNKFQNLNGK